MILLMLFEVVLTQKLLSPEGGGGERNCCVTIEFT